MENRPIKFRGWHTEKKIMFSAEQMAQDQLTLLPTGEFINVSGVSTKLSTIFPRDKFIPLQFTGLRDKNRVEDYVGNIWEVEYCGEKHRFVREIELNWSGYIFDFRCITGEVSPIHANVDEDGEIVGNIYENPELLEE